MAPPQGRECWICLKPVKQEVQGINTPAARDHPRLRNEHRDSCLRETTGRGGRSDVSLHPTHTRVNNPEGSASSSASLSLWLSGPSNAPGPLSLLFPGSLMPRCQASPTLAFLCSHRSSYLDILQLRCHLLREAFSHLPSQEASLGLARYRSSPKEMPLSLMVHADIYGLAEASSAWCL